MEPWGETRADLRMAAQAITSLGPYLPETATVPDLTYPYFGREEQIDFLAVEQAIIEHEQEYGRWPRQ